MNKAQKEIVIHLFELFHSTNYITVDKDGDIALQKKEPEKDNNFWLGEMETLIRDFDFGEWEYGIPFEKNWDWKRNSKISFFKWEGQGGWLKKGDSWLEKPKKGP